MKNRIILDFLKFSGAKCEIKANAILAAMTGNSYFKTPNPTLKVLQTAIADFSAHLAAAQSKDTVKVQLKNASRKALNDILVALANYVTMIANGDRAILASSGFTISAATRGKKVLSAVNNFSVKMGDNSGEAIVSVDTVTNATLYTILFAKAPVTDGKWQHEFSNTPSATIKNLEPMVPYCFRIAVTGSNNQVLYTEIITKAIL